jgi:hypothetical protein
MNVVGDDEVWISYYTDFPLVAIKNFQLHRAWKDFSCISRAFAVHRDSVIFPKCYTRMEGRSQLLVRALSDSSEAEAAEAVDESDSIIGGHFSAIGRGPHFYLLTDSALYRLQL